MTESDSRRNHPVWVVYDALRTLRLNNKYYGRRLQRFERIDFWFELILAISAPSSAIAGIFFWDTESGKVAWQLLSVIAALAALLKPLLKLTKRIQKYENVLTEYRRLEGGVRKIVQTIETDQKYDSHQKSEFSRLMEYMSSLSDRSPEPDEHKDTKIIAQREVLEELPKSQFFIPEK